MVNQRSLLFKTVKQKLRFEQWGEKKNILCGQYLIWKKMGMSLSGREYAFRVEALDSIYPRQCTLLKEKNKGEKKKEIKESRVLEEQNVSMAGKEWVDWIKYQKFEMDFKWGPGQAEYNVELKFSS